jgi:hypothetical protein
MRPRAFYRPGHESGRISKAKLGYRHLRPGEHTDRNSNTRRRPELGMEPEPAKPLGFSGVDSITLAELAFKVAIGEEAFQMESLDELIEHVDRLSSKE